MPMHSRRPRCTSVQDAGTSSDCGLTLCCEPVPLVVLCEQLGSMTISWASSRSEVMLAEYLVDRGANPNFWSQTFSRSLLLEFFEQRSPAEHLAALIEKGAELTTQERERILHICAANDDFEVSCIRL